jgi:hypothetical protein
LEPVAGAPAHVDFRLDASRRKELDLPGHDLEDLCFRQVFSDYENNRQQIIDDRSPIKWPEKLHRKTPILILHGTSDLVGARRGFAGDGGGSPEIEASVPARDVGRRAA